LCELKSSSVVYGNMRILGLINVIRTYDQLTKSMLERVVCRCDAKILTDMIVMSLPRRQSVHRRWSTGHTEAPVTRLSGAGRPSEKRDPCTDVTPTAY